jgi:hypothetical protein
VHPQGGRAGRAVEQAAQYGLGVVNTRVGSLAEEVGEQCLDSASLRICRRFQQICCPPGTSC